MDYTIIMDASGDLDTSVSEFRNARYLPMEYSLGSQMRLCSGPESAETLRRFYNGQRSGDLTRTSQISPFTYEESIRPFFEQGLSVLCLCLSGGLSATYNSACMAKASLEESWPGLKFCPIDSLSASGGMGILYERALRNRQAGMSLEENCADITAAAHKMRHWFLVQDLMYLKRGGRVSAATAAVGTALNIRPILCINTEGKLDTIAKKRGSKLAAQYVLERFEETFDGSSGDVIYIIDADNPEMSELLAQEVQKRCPNAIIRRSMLSPIIGAHTGPGMAAICHMGK